jgi:DNA-directed RNA polymerase specialized sigma subunit
MTHLRFTRELTQQVADVLHLTLVAVSRLQRRTLAVLGERLLAMVAASA